MIKVLDLFSGTQSVKKALTEKYAIDFGLNINGIGKGFKDHGYESIVKVEYIGIDICSPEDENTIFNLAQREVIQNLVHVLPHKWKPNFIGASPICNKFSSAVTGKGGNAYFLVQDNVLVPRVGKNDYEYVKHNKINTRPNLGKQYEIDARLALQLHENTKEIIEYFNVPFAIENPGTSLAKHIYKDFYRNKAEYCGYGFEYRKPTAIYSQKTLNLARHNKNDNHRCLRFDRINQINNGPSHGNKNNSTYANRSSVPQKLIIDVINQSGLMNNE